MPGLLTGGMFDRDAGFEVAVCLRIAIANAVKNQRLECGVVQAGIGSNLFEPTPRRGCRSPWQSLPASLLASVTTSFGTSAVSRLNSLLALSCTAAIVAVGGGAEPPGAAPARVAPLGLVQPGPLAFAGFQRRVVDSGD